MSALRGTAATGKAVSRFLGRSVLRPTKGRSSLLSCCYRRYSQKQTAFLAGSLRGATAANSWQRRQYSTEPLLAEVTIGSSNLSFNKVWLRENCQCPECFNYASNQRNILYYTLSEEQTTIASQEIKGEDLQITWADGHITSFPVTWLQEHAIGGAPEPIKKLTWDNETLTRENIPRVPHKEFMTSDDGLKKLLGSLLKYGIGLVSGSSADIEGTQAVAERVCHIQETLFGRMWSFTADMARGDTAYTNWALGAHTDTTYLQLPAGIQMFHVMHHDGEGGQTLLVDGFRAAEKLRRNNPDAFNLLKSTRVHHRYIETGKNGHYTRSLDTILVTDPITDELINIRYNHYDRAPLTTIPHDQLPAFYDALSELSSYVTEPEGEHWLKLTPGTVLFVDNFRVMHGRAAFTGNRKVCGCYLPRDDWVSKARIHGLTW